MNPRFQPWQVEQTETEFLPVEVDSISAAPPEYAGVEDTSPAVIPNAGSIEIVLADRHHVEAAGA